MHGRALTRFRGKTGGFMNSLDLHKALAPGNPRRAPRSARTGNGRSASDQERQLQATAYRLMEPDRVAIREVGAGRNRSTSNGSSRRATWRASVGGARSSDPASAVRAGKR